MASPDIIAPKGHSSLLGTGGAQTLCSTYGYVLHAGGILAHIRVYTGSLPRH